MTPNIVGVVKDPGAWDPNNPEKMRFYNEMKARQLQLSQGDKFCPTQT